MAFQQPQTGFRQPPEQPVPLDGLPRVLGAGRLEPAARPEQRRDPALVATDDHMTPSLHDALEFGFIRPVRRRAASQLSRSTAKLTSSA